MLAGGGATLGGGRTDDDLIHVPTRHDAQAALMNAEDGEVSAAPRRDVRVGVHADEQVVADLAGGFQDLEVAKVEQVEAPVYVHDARAGRRGLAVGKLNDPAGRREEGGDGGGRGGLVRGCRGSRAAEVVARGAE